MKFNYALRYFPFALLLVIVIWAFLALDPVYCTWLYPFKAVTESTVPVCVCCHLIEKLKLRIH